MKLIEPHGGKLINRVLKGAKAETAYAQARLLPHIDVAPETMLDIQNIATGVFSPLEGFVSKEDYDSILNHKRLTNGLPWTIPILFPIGDENAASIHKGQDLAVFYQREPLAILHVEQKFMIDRRENALKIYGTDDLHHPGVQKMWDSGSWVVSGKIDVFNTNNANVANSEFNLSPATVRSIIQQKGWKTVAGFQTRNPPHRAHEYLQRTALEYVDGLFIQPLVGWKKSGDFKPEAIIKAYRALIQHYYPSQKVLFGLLTTPMRYAGPREAVFHAIIRKNFGCTHFIVGRDHAGVGSYYDKYAAHAIFDQMEDLGINILRLCGPYYCQRCDLLVTEKTCGHDGIDLINISGTKIREYLRRGQKMPPYFMRPEVSSLISESDFL